VTVNVAEMISNLRSSLPFQQHNFATRGQLDQFPLGHSLKAVLIIGQYLIFVGHHAITVSIFSMMSSSTKRPILGTMEILIPRNPTFQNIIPITGITYEEIDHGIFLPVRHERCSIGGLPSKSIANLERIAAKITAKSTTLSIRSQPPPPLYIFLGCYVTLLVSETHVTLQYNLTK
jgi:hypothetical protein